MANYTDEELLTALTPKTSSSSIWGLGMSGVSDIFNGLMALPNLIALIGLSGLVVKITREHFQKK